MSYDLIPRNKNIQGITVGAFSWQMYLQDSGAGFVIGYGKGLIPTTYVYQPRKKPGSPVSNDGYYVTSSQAKMMSIVIDGFISVHRFIRKEIDSLPQERVKEMEQANERLSWKTYNIPYPTSHLDKLEAISKFLKNSKGFYIE